ncbi:MAG: phage holin [Lactobacillus sp.]|nr:phage holin [Lactobacillus sp.]
MTIKDWLYLGITIASYLLAIIAGIYTRNKDKINRATRAGQVMDILGKLATNAVHEAEYLGGTGEEKREVASEIISQGLNWFGIKSVTPNQINGSIEKAVNAMHLANNDVNSITTDEVATDVPQSDIVLPTEPDKDVTINGN